MNLPYDPGAPGAMEPGAELPEQEIDLRALWRVLLKRRQVIGLVLAVVFVTTAIVTLAMKPTYRGTAQLLIERRAPNVLPFQEVAVTDPTTDWKAGEMFYQTQIKLLQSRAVATRVLNRLKLRQSEEFEKVRRKIERGSLEGEPDVYYTEAFLDRVQVKQVKKSRLFDVSYLSHDPKRAAAVANAVAEEYIRLNQEVSSTTTETATLSLEEQIRSLEEEVRRRETELQVYARENNLVYLDDRQNVVLKALQDLTGEYNRARSERIDRQARYQAMRRADPESVREVLNSRMIGELRASYSRLAQQHGEMSSTYGADWPQMRELEARMQAAKKRLDTETRNIVTRVVKAAEVEYQKALERERGLERAIEAQTTEAQTTDMAAIRYKAMKADLDSKKTNLDAMFRRAGEAGISAGIEPVAGSNVRIIDRASVPPRPYRPRKGLNLALGLILGLLGGVAAAFFLEYLDNTVKTDDEAEQILRVPVLARVPHWEQAGASNSPATGRRTLATLLKKGRAAGGSRRSTGFDSICAREPSSPASEAFRELRTALLLSSPDDPPRSILVTSPIPQDGKTAVAANLAIALAQAGKRVLLVDADLRQPHLHRSLGVPNEAGIGNVLAGTHTLDEITRPTGIANLHLITSGPLPPNPAELLGSGSFRAFLADLERLQYDQIVFDSGPALSVVDPIILASQVQAVLLVLRAGLTPREAAREVRAKLAQSRARLLGCVLNGVTPGHGAYAYRYAYSPAPAAQAAVPSSGEAAVTEDVEHLARLEEAREKIARRRASS